MRVVGLVIEDEPKPKRSGKRNEPVAEPVDDQEAASDGDGA